MMTDEVGGGSSGSTNEVGGGSSGSTNEERRTGKEEEISLGEPELMRQKENPQDSEQGKGGVNRDEGVIRADEGVDSNAFSGFNSADGGGSGGRGGQSKEDQPEVGGEDTPTSTSKSIASSVPCNAPPSKPKFTSRNLNATLKPMLGSSQKEKTVTKFTESGKLGGRLVVLAHKRLGEDMSPLASAMEAPTIAPLSSAGGGITRMDSLEGRPRTQTSDSSVVNPPSGLATGNGDSTGGTAVPSWGSRVETNERRALESSKKMAWGAAVMGKKEEKQTLNGGGVESGVPPNQRAVHDKRDPYPYPRRADQSHPSEGDFGPAQSPSYSGVNGGMPSSSNDVNRAQQQRPYNNFQGGRRSASFDRDNASCAHGGGGGGRGIGGGGYMQNGQWGDRSGGGSGPRGGDYQNENQHRTDRYWGHDDCSRDVKDSRYARTGGGDGSGGGGWRERGSPMPNADTVMNWRSNPRGFGGRDLEEGRGDRGEPNVNIQQQQHQQKSRFTTPLVTYHNGGEQGRGGRDGGIKRGEEADHHFAPDKHDQHGLKQHHHPLSPSHGGNDGAAPLSARPDGRSPAIGDHMHSKQQRENITSSASWEASTALNHSSTPTLTSAADDSLGFVLGADPYASPRDVPPFDTNSHFPGDNMSLDNPAASGHSSSTKDQRQKNPTMSSGAAMAAGMPSGTQYQQQRYQGRPVGWHPGGGVGHQHMAVHHHQSLQESERSRHNYHASSGGAWGSKSTSILSAGAHNHVGPGKEMGRAMEPSVGPSVPKQLYDPNTNQMVEAPRKRTQTHDLGTPSYSRPQQAAEQQSNAVPSLTKKQQQLPHGAAVPGSPSAVLQLRSPASIMRREHKEKERSDSNTGMEPLRSPLPPPSSPHGDHHHSTIYANEATAASPFDVKYDKMPGLAGASVTALNSSNTKSESVIMHRDSTNRKGGERSRVIGKKGGSVTGLHEQQSSKEDSSQQLMTRGQKEEQIIHKPLAQQRSGGGGNESKTTTAVVCDETEVQRRRMKRAQERRLRPPRTSGLLFARDSDGSLKCVDDMDTILSQRSKEVCSLLVSWKVINPELLQKHLSSHGSQPSVPMPCTTSMPPRQSGNNPWTKSSEPTISKKKAPVQRGPNTTTPLPRPVSKKVESNGLETGWPNAEIKNETCGGESKGNDLLPEVSSLPPKPPVVASGSSNAGRGSGGVSSRGRGSKHGGKKGWGGGDRRNGGGGEPHRRSDRPSQFHRAQAQAPVLSKGGGGGSTNSKTPPVHESQKDKAPQISSEVSSRGRKPRISRRSNRGGGKAGGQKQVSDRSDSKRDNNFGASQSWKGSGAPPSQVTNSAPT